MINRGIVASSSSLRICKRVEGLSIIRALDKLGCFCKDEARTVKYLVELMLEEGETSF